MTTISTQQILSQAVVSALVVSIMASAMGIMMGAIGASAYTVPPSELKGTEAAVRELKLAYGADVVDRAVKAVGTNSMLALAQETERLIIEDMNAKYGPLATEAALAAAPPGDVAMAKDIANMLANRGVKPQNMPDALVGATAPAVAPTTNIQAAGAQVVRAAKSRGKQKAKPVLDTKTGIQYKSKASAGMSVATEYGLDPSDTYIWYEVIKKDPTRFRELSALSPTAPVSSATAYQPPRAVTAYPPPKL